MKHSFGLFLGYVGLLLIVFVAIPYAEGRAIASCYGNVTIKSVKLMGDDAEITLESDLLPVTRGSRTTLIVHSRPDLKSGVKGTIGVKLPGFFLVAKPSYKFVPHQEPAPAK